jgi:dihydroorotate dehydrogenase electron transfer subunit
MVAPGQFINIKLDGFFLRRPFSVADWDENGLMVYYKTVGEGTRALAQYARGRTINALIGLGHGFDCGCSARPLIIGGGVGVPPLFALAKRFISMGIIPTVLIGFASGADEFLSSEFRLLGCNTIVTLETDGLRVTDRILEIQSAHDMYFACGPEGMLRAVHRICRLPGQLSVETRMACGVGLCRGCTCDTLAGGKRICVDGPVFRKEILRW